MPAPFTAAETITRPRGGSSHMDSSEGTGTLGYTGDMTRMQLELNLVDLTTLMAIYKIICVNSIELFCHWRRDKGEKPKTAAVVP